MNTDRDHRRELGGTTVVSPSEIGFFVKVAPHNGATKIDYDRARQIYSAARQVRFS